MVNHSKEAGTEFEAQWKGVFYGLLSWQQLSEFWSRIDRDGGWYLYAIGSPLPVAPSTPEQVDEFIRHLDELLRREHQEEYCGIVYADHLETPSMVKIFDPNNLGVSCGSSKVQILPGWVMSKAAPTELHPHGIVPANRKRWWHGFLSLTGQ